ncbi:MAG: excinuclease ABC subunit UvrA [bacterium]
MQEYIVIKGAREHNLKNISLKIPRDRIVVITGPSGSGKSSLAIDTIYAEGQRRYVESLSSYARQFIGEMQKPDADTIEGLSPSIAIDQKTISLSPRSTVGTVTDIYNYLRVFYTHAGTASCHQCGRGIASQDTEALLDSIMSLPEGTRIQLLAPVVRERKGEHRGLLESLKREGFIRARIDGIMFELSDELKLNKHKRHTIEVVVDRLIVKKGFERKLQNALEIALRYGDTITINLIDRKKDIIFSKKFSCPECGTAYPELSPRLFSFNSKIGACPKCNGLGHLGEEFGERGRVCDECQGMRLRKEALSVRVEGMNIIELSRLPVGDISRVLSRIEITERQRYILKRVIREIIERLSFLSNVGLDYLSLDRTIASLSGGEAQRVRLAHQLGSSLTGVLYVLDEPSIGLHPSDCSRLMQALRQLRDSDNSILIVEHDEDTIRSADHIIDMGPTGGNLGGYIIATGTPGELSGNPQSITGRYLSGELSIPMPPGRRTPKDFLTLRGASAFNLKNITVRVPLGVMVCVTGVSGSGKSTLVFEVLHRALTAGKKLNGQKRDSWREIVGADRIDRVIYVNQSPLGRSPRSNPATYTGFFTFVRELFAQLPDARVRGYTSSRFSFNLKGGRCEDCQGEGMIKYEMHFLPDVYVLCRTCKGARFNTETLAVRYKEKSIADVLSMTVSEALDFFHPIPHIRQRLELLNDVGLGYIRLGQPAITLSGGEAQRVKLSRELAKKSAGGALYILDEPTTGLHFVDIGKLLGVFNRLVEKGNTVLIIEHNPDIIKSADYIIDMGPGAGEDGGRVIAEGTPEQVAQIHNSITGNYLRRKYFVRGDRTGTGSHQV